MLASKEALQRPALVVSDVHLSSTGGSAASRALAALLEGVPSAELVLAGDTLDLSLEPRRQHIPGLAAALLQYHPRLTQALRRHLSQGGAVTLLGGNHDAEAFAPGVRERLLASLGVQADAPLELEPWMLLRGGVLIEHGHRYDPDNAPAHPLELWGPRTEPLGVALTRRFLAPSGTLAFAHAHEVTPVAGLARAFRLYGARTPLLLARYFGVALQLVAEAGAQDYAGERRRGDAKLTARAATLGLEPALLRRLLAVGARPTHEDRRATFLRLYFDRVAATLCGVGGVGAALTGSAGAALLAGGASWYLARSVKAGGSRGAGLPERRLREAGERIAELSGAQLVVMGHTHRVEQRPRYVNVGSFTYCGAEGRPYLSLDERGRPRLERAPR